ncbi:hypothetical protein EXU57_12610 [Segetibacter sp. 3557_3]|uniref:hypothetical protein n=1 Tax=Segetibacter sp. 3557_3 TaxID=2547429 RepID=UPI001058CBEE|nr:hypothetical protein [Segetibacter sp. 3557_3]TDH25542.1 hypothetical protein EXU57_12610 [Segetibacter sp. 3557_3]
MLSKYELELVTNSEVILTKNRIIQKVYALFGELSERYGCELAGTSSELVAISPKISRGENYLGLPYVMLDQPRIFSRLDVCAIRTFFWWGNFFSITLQLSGEHLDKYYPVLKSMVEAGEFEGWFISNGAGEWDHHFGQENYTEIKQGFPIDEQARFLKIATKLSLDQWIEAEHFLFTAFKKLLIVLNKD